MMIMMSKAKMTSVRYELNPNVEMHLKHSEQSASDVI